MRTFLLVPRSLWALLWLCCALALPAHGFDDDDLLDEMDEVKPEELLHEDIPVDERIFQTRWQAAPFDTRQFDYTPLEIKNRWSEFMVGIRAPYPSPELLRTLIQRYPEMVEGVEAFNGDYDDFSRRNIEVWRLFLRGDFQAAREEGLKLGLLGFYPAMFAQTMYAMYLTERQSEKYMMLQDVANRAKAHFDLLERAENDPDAAEFVAFARLGYAYAIARIAEESPVPVIVFRRYIGKIKDGAEEVLNIIPDHPLGHTFRAAVDAGIMRRVGRATGRMTYGARTTVVDGSFRKAFAMAPDVPILNYEYANALIYMGRKRDLPTAYAHAEKAARFIPHWSMDALDTLYAQRRLQEIRLFDQEYRSFRGFERHRRRFSRVTDRNLTNVLAPVLSGEMLQHPEKYRLPPRP